MVLQIGTYSHSAQANYDAVLTANEVTAAIGFHSTGA